MEDNTTSSSASMNQLLHDAALQGDVALLQDLLRRDPFLVYRSSTTTTPPLHVACKFGYLQFALELLRLNPSLSEEVDPNDKSSPLHVASRSGHFEVVAALVTVNPGTCFARDLHGMNPVHVAAVKGHLQVLDELLRALPAAAKERAGGSCTGGGESILHLCVKYSQAEALRLVVSAVGDAEMLNAVNGEGDSVLHLAVANKQLEIVSFLLGDGRVKKNTLNSGGLTAMDIFTKSHKDVLKDPQLKSTLKRYKVLPFEDIKRENEKHQHLDWLESQRTILMVVASMVAAMAYQAGTSSNPPTQASKEHTKMAYQFFLLLNMIGFGTSMSSILLLISRLPCRRFLMAIVMMHMWTAITTMTAAYGFFLYGLVPEDDAQDEALLTFNALSAYVMCLVLTWILHLWLFTRWTVRFLKHLGRLLVKLFRCCFPKRREIDP